MDYFSEGNKYYNFKDFKRAIELYNASIKNNQNLTCSYYNAGVCYIKLKDFDSAISMIEKAISIQKESKYFFNLAYCHAMKEEVKKALIYFNIAWSLDNSDTDCEKAIKLIMEKLEKKKKAQ